jgi:hypothetical protein
MLFGTNKWSIWGRNGNLAMYTSANNGNSPRPLTANDRHLRVAELWAHLEDEDRVALLSALGDGLLDARWAVQEMIRPGHAGSPVVSLLASLNRAILELSRARELLAVRAEEATQRTAPPSLLAIPGAG